MSRYRKVLTRIWKDEKFRPLAADPRMLFLYHLTSDQSTPFLLYVERFGSIVDALSMTSRRLRDAMQTLSAIGLSRYSTDGSDYVFLPKALLIAENAPNGPNAVTTWLNLFRDMPSTSFRRACVDHWRSLKLDHPHTRSFVDGIHDDVETPSQMTSRERLDSGAVAVAVAVAVAGTGEEERPTADARGALSMDDFDRFWQIYPNKVGKEAARVAWKRRGCAAIADAVIAGLLAQMDYLMRDGGKFIPNPSTWLNQGRWEDEPRRNGSHPHLSARTRGNIDAVQTFIEGGESHGTPGQASLRD